MASKKPNRTFNKLWLINYGAVLVIITLQLSCAIASVSETKEEALENEASTGNNSTSENPVAEALIRYRRQPPRTVVKHIIRPKRYKMKRLKRPKTKYSFAEPPATYFSRKPIIFKKPTFDSSILEGFSHMNVEAADFDLPPSSYEAQSMDLDFYKHYEPSIQAASYKEIHTPSLYTYQEPEINYKETSYTEVTQPPELSFKEARNPSVTYTYEAENLRKPHTKYGVPTNFAYSTGYDKPNGNKYTFETPANKPVYTEIEYSYNKPGKELPRIPATNYGVPDVHIPATSSNNYNKYSIVEQKQNYANRAPAKTETYHFAEPPQPESSVEINYSPSYEINIPSPNDYFYSKENYHKRPQHPQPPPPQIAPNGYEQANYQEQPPQQYDPSVNYQPTNDYEGLQQDNYEDDAASHQEVSGTNQPVSYQPAPARHQPIEEFPPSQNLPINANHKPPPYDYPKSSYEVPIYDPIPFDSSNHQEREIYPPQTYEQPHGQQSSPNNNQHPAEKNPPNLESSLDDILSSDTEDQTNNRIPQSPINHLRHTRTRKRNKGSATTVSTTKHILDVPELEEAFENENRNKFGNNQEPDARASQRFENVENQNIINNSYSKGPWNPMKIRTSPIMLMTAPTNIPPVHTISMKNKRYHYKQQRTPSTSTTTNTSITTSLTTTEAPTKVEIISIEKSKSKSFYDGVFSTPKMYNINFNRNRFRLENTSTFATPQSYDKTPVENKFSKRTTKNAFDTTIFKSPINDRDVYRNLPKNHKFI